MKHKTKASIRALLIILIYIGAGVIGYWLFYDFLRFDFFSVVIHRTYSLFGFCIGVLTARLLWLTFKDMRDDFKE